MEPRVREPNVNFVKYRPLILYEEQKPDDQESSSQKKKDPDQVDLQEILDCIVPPEIITVENSDFIKQLSPEPVSRKDVENLISDLDARLVQLRLSKTGFCSTRSQIYEEAFNELIRQVTIQCAEQGLLLIRVRNEARMTLKAYQTLYENSTAIAVRKIEEVKRSKGKLVQKIKDVTEEILKLDEELVTAQHRYRMVDKRSNEITYAVSVTQENDLGYLNNGIRQTKVIHNILSSLKAKDDETE